MTALEAPQKRFTFPHPDPRAIKVEPIVQPLYSCAIYDNAALSTQSELFFFRYAVGQEISGLAAAAGTTASTELHTNMSTANQLPTPKLMLVTGARVLFSNLDSVFTEPLETHATTAETPPVTVLTDILEVFYGTWFRFFVGTKNYIEVPTCYMPGNVGVGGLGETALSGVVTTGPDFVQVSSFNSTGKEYTLGKHTVFIPPQQNFFCSLNASQATPPTVAVEMAIYAVLDGVFGREVQ